MGTPNIIGNNNISVTGQSITSGLGDVSTIAQSIVNLDGLESSVSLANVLVYGEIGTDQTPNYAEVDTSQTASLSDISTSQTANLSTISTSQTPSLSEISTSQTPNYEEVA